MNMSVRIRMILITSKDPEAVLSSLKTVYTIKSSAKLSYYLGGDYKYDSEEKCCILEKYRKIKCSNDAW